MKTRARFDFPLLLNDNQSATLVFQKSAEGEAILNKAFDAWKSETSAVPAAPAAAPPLSADTLPVYKFAHAATEPPVPRGNADSRYLTVIFRIIKSHLRESPELHLDRANKPGKVDFYVDQSGKLVGRKLVS